MPGLALLVWFALPHGFSDGGLRLAREGAARSLLVQLSEAIAIYEIEQEVYPSGDGTGSRNLLTCLREKGSKKQAYFEVPTDMVDAKGNLLSPVEEGKIVSYRCPGVHNPKTFDLWCEDAKGRVDGINNWEK